MDGLGSSTEGRDGYRRSNSLSDVPKEVIGERRILTHFVNSQVRLIFGHEQRAQSTDGDNQNVSSILIPELSHRP
jgi:hypothetical protein